MDVIVCKCHVQFVMDKILYMNFLRRINQKLPSMLNILLDESEALKESPSFRLQIIMDIWNEPLHD
jgi:hypothetical protein